MALKEKANSLSPSEIALLNQRIDKEKKCWWDSFYDDSESKIQRGIIRLKNGTIIRFAFISHHLTTDGQSYSYFVTGNYSKYVTGWFCCEMEFGSTEQPENLSQFNDLLNKIR